MSFIHCHIVSRKVTFKPRAMANEMRDEFGERVSVVVIPNASHALLPEQPAAVADAILSWTGKLPR